ncbi:unnamed protein product [Symbiodinium sp. KB8]|nr:unnamed protein product [Symbiodinium sp. KB8]
MTTMDVDAEEAARAKTAREEMLLVMGGQASTEIPAPNASGEPEKETEADDENRRKWPKPSTKDARGAQQGGWHGSWGSQKRQWEAHKDSSSSEQLPQLDRATQDLMRGMVRVRVVLRHEAEIQRQTADNWQEQFSQGTVKSPLRLVLFMTMLQLLKSKAEELLSDETKLQRCMTVGWTVEGPNALSPAWVYHSWDPSAKKQVVAETQPLAHAEALRQVDLLLHQDGALKNFKTARRMSAKDSYTAEVLPWMVSIGLRGESSNICYNALKMSGSAIMKLIGVRIRPERGQEPQLIKQDNVLRLGEEQCALEQRRLGRPTVGRLGLGPEMSVLSIELPRHIQYAAMEEVLLLQALRNLYQPRQLDPCFALFTRNELVYAAARLLAGPEMSTFIRYADQLAQSLQAHVLVQLPLPSIELCRGAVCQLLNTLVIATLGTHGWTSLSVNMNCSTEVHKDQCNASEDHFQSLQIGLSHYDQGQLWIEDPKGCIYLEHHRDGLLRGSAHNTQATASLFHAQKHYHATLPWSNGDRVVLIAYVARQHACAVQRYGGILEGLALSCHIARSQHGVFDDCGAHTNLLKATAL